MQNSSRQTSPLAGTLVALLMLAFAALLVWLSIYWQRPPAAVPDNAAQDQFSSGRAVKDIQAIAQRPHPLGTTEHAAVRDYLTKELTNMGLTPEVQETTVVERSWNGNVAATVQNIMTRLKGTGNSKAVMLVAHYDSVPTGPGASDDGAGVAVILETLRALRTGPPLKNDVIALLTDGEEAGLLGANAFVNEHPWAKDVGLVLNLEARGNRGSSLMFETSDGNGRLIREVASTTQQPIANSLMQDIYKKLLSNDTDLTVFKGAGLPGLNFAYIEGDTAYHSVLDSADHIDQRTLQDQGQQSLSLTRHFGGLDLTDVSAPNAVYFNPIGHSLVHYSQSLVLPLALIVLLLLLALIVWGFKKKQLTVTGILLGFVGTLLSIIGALLLTRVLLWVALRGAGMEGPFRLSYDRNLYNVGFVALTFALTAVVYLLFRRKANIQSMLAGGLLWWALLTVAVSVLLPGGGYMFAWPLLCGLCGLAAMIASGGKRSSPALVVGACLLAIIVPLVLLSPLLQLILVGVSVSLAPAVMSLVVLLSWMLLPQFEFIGELAGNVKRWVLPALAFVIGAICLGAAIVRSPRDRNEPVPDGVFYILDASKNRAVWASEDENPDEYTEQFLSANPERGTLDDYLPLIYGMYLKKETQPVALPAPSVELLNQSREANSRTFQLHVKSPRQAPALSLFLDAQTKVLEASVNNKRIATENPGGGPGGDEKWILNYSNPTANGFDVTLKVEGDKPLNVTLVDQSYELPPATGAAIKPRPDYIIPARFPLANSTLVSKSYSFQ